MLNVLSLLRYRDDVVTSIRLNGIRGYLRGQIAMPPHVLVPLFCALIVVAAGCKKHETPPPVPRSGQESNRPQIDVCGLLTKEEIEAIQGSSTRETKSSARSDGALPVSHCLYTA